MCGPRQFFFFQCGAEMLKGWTPLTVASLALSPLTVNSSWPWKRGPGLRVKILFFKKLHFKIQTDRKATEIVERIDFLYIFPSYFPINILLHFFILSQFASFCILFILGNFVLNHHKHWINKYWVPRQKTGLGSHKPLLTTFLQRIDTKPF